MPNIGFPEMIVILIIILIVFGPGKLPELGSKIGKSFKEFKKALKDDDEDKKPVKKTK